MSDKKVLAKIKKCLALAKSSNANEAATALRQAQALMEKHNVNDETIALSGIETAECSVGTVRNPPQYHQALVSLMKRAFGVEPLYLVDWECTKVKFIGMESQALVASYAYEVLYRQLKKDRSAYMKTLRRYRKVNKTRKADLFALHWVIGVYEKVQEFVQSEENKALINRYMDAEHSKVEPTKQRTHKAKAQDRDAIYSGYQAGKNADLHRGMSGDETKRLEAV
ncbi:DUF2786 domain-containing protein [Endozoicomonas gorgoniicola]|uniref:DUF2786 domain-containing protein n=1 Tax=Endozoicomonas gorgoniicola TaxID=1234144 RepID=A0ABT3MT87_9GAMM|nr:DUF2786 domain-containing protein [Endozoicomonas gorgoniicola]MCW7552567.1 DUF2786 domain-containing protein [Endozoicomonas gorgoniicola]